MAGQLAECPNSGLAPVVGSVVGLRYLLRAGRGAVLAIGWGTCGYCHQHVRVRLVYSGAVVMGDHTL